MIFCVCPMSGTTPLTARCLMWMEFWVSLVLYDTVKSLEKEQEFLEREERGACFMEMKDTECLFRLKSLNLVQWSSRFHFCQVLAWTQDEKKGLRQSRHHCMMGKME